MGDWIRPYLDEWLEQTRTDAHKYRRLVDEYNSEFEKPVTIMEGLEGVVYQLDEIITELRRKDGS